MPWRCFRRLDSGKSRRRSKRKLTLNSDSRADVAEFCLRELVDDRYLNQAPVITY